MTLPFFNSAGYFDWVYSLRRNTAAPSADQQPRQGKTAMPGEFIYSGRNRMRYSFDSRVRYSEVDENGKLTTGSLINYFQDCSTFQAEDLGMGVGVLKDRSQAWILAYWQIVMERMPVLAERISAATWAYEFKAFYGLRNFTLTGGDGQLCAWANSVWILFDTEKQRPVRVPADEAQRYAPEEKLAMDYAPRRIRLKDLPGFKGMDPVIVERHHLDTNHHVNNGQYVQIASQFLPERAVVRQIRAEYKGQARLGDVMVPEVSSDNGCVTVHLKNPQGDSFVIVEFMVQA